MDKYRLIVFGDDWDVYRVAYRDWIEDPKIVYIPTFRPKGLSGFLQKVHFNPKLNQMIQLPGKQCWNDSYLQGVVEDKMCFLMTDHWMRMEGGIKLLPYLRKKYPEARVVCFAQDLMAMIRDHYLCRPVDVDYLKKYADLVISYDKEDAQRYGILYHPTVFSPIHIEQGMFGDHYDLFFLGRDKGRLNHLVNICRAATERGLKCHFIMLEVPCNERVECDGMVYSDEPIPYMDNLRYCAESRCVVEMLQHHASSPTYRTWEAISLNKKLMTNSESIKDSEIYDERYISVFHDESDFDWDFVERTDVFQGGNPYQELIRPEALVKFIEKELNIKIDRA